MGGGAGGYPSGSAEVCQQPAQALATMLNDGSKGLKTSSASSSALGAGLPPNRTASPTARVLTTTWTRDEAQCGRSQGELDR